MDEAILLNPDGKLITDIERELFLARKTKPLWAKRVDTKQSIETLEGALTAEPGDYLCRGVEGEHWPQKAGKLEEKYDRSGVRDADGWERFDPKPGAPPVDAVQVKTAFRVKADWGELTGKALDFVVRSTTDPTGIWIVAKEIFEATYQRESK